MSYPISNYINFSLKQHHFVSGNNSLLNIFVFLNSLVISFTDLEYGKSILLFTSILFNILLSLQCGIKSKKVSRPTLYAILLIFYLLVRQIILLANNYNFNSETYSTLLFLTYTFCFASCLPYLMYHHLIAIVRIYVYFNLFFGLPDFFGFDIGFTHTSSNVISRFRGLANEPNLLAIPLLLFAVSLFFIKKKSHIIKFDIIVSILMIFLSYSKSAYLVLAILIFYFAFKSKMIKKVFIFSTILILVLLVYLLREKLYLLPFYNNFISLLDFNLLIKLRLNEYISLLSQFDQSQAGSLGTRLTTFIASVYTIFSNLQVFIFGVGGGFSHTLLIDYIFSNNLENYELRYHLFNQPDFITDKTYLVKFMLEYGLIGIFLLYLFLFSVIYKGYRFSRENRLYHYFLMTLVLFLCQSHFFLVFIFISLYLHFSYYSIA